MTQQAVADRSSAHVTQIRRYEGGSSQPTLDVLRNLALALHTSADSLLFDADERGPATPNFRLLLGALDTLDTAEQAAVVTLLEGVLMRHQLRQVPAMGQPNAS